MKGPQLTEISKKNVAAVMRFSQNAEFARKYLEQGIRVRTFPETLVKYSGISDMTALRDTLRQKLAGMPGEPSADSLRRKVDMWLNGKTAPESRDQLIRICFALDMSEQDAQNFLATAGEGCLHRRNPVELAYLFALRNRLSYDDALRLIERIRPIVMGGEGETELIGEKFENVKGEEAFVRFVNEERLNLGEMHNTAFYYFERYLDVLANPDASFMDQEEQTYSVRDIVQMYLALPGGGSGVLVKALRKHWPDEATLSRIVNRRIDVPRKVLTLLFLTTDGADGSELDTDDPRKLFVDRYRRCNEMLDDCGYSQLDPRSVFDWLAIYCMYITEENDSNALMQEVLRDVFSR